MSDEEPRVAMSLGQIGWFQRVLEDAKTGLREVPDRYRPGWVRRHPEALTPNPSTGEAKD